jgi:hypothetical protein
MKKQTAVQRLVEQLRFTHKEAYNDLYEVIQQTLEMEKKQIVEAVKSVHLEYRVYNQNGEYEFSDLGEEVVIGEPNQYIGLSKTGEQYYKETYED